jgi:hypothetical protein
MALRITRDKVTEIVEWQDGSNGTMIPLEPFMKQANILTDWLASVDADSELSDATLIEIELQLAAHFYSVERDKQFASKSTNGASGSFDGSTGFALQATHFGQTAMLLDVTARLTKRNLESQHGKRVATVTWVGWQDHSEDPY